ncbi:MAG: SIMPL domain-containing protein [Myxococcales bacterium]|nr:MAG: SIMPL domain-containing protein [Myxococcales bacterium]
MFYRIPILLFVLTGCAGHTVVVHDASQGEAYGLSVNGSARLTGKPDVARATIGVQVRATSVDDAERLAKKQMTSIVNAIKAKGVADRDLQTSNYSINFVQDSPPRPEPGKETSSKAELPTGHYVVNNQLDVSVRKLDTLGDVLAAATKAGANNIWGIRFELEDSAALEAKARAKAVQDAKEKAKALAELSGATLGPLLAVSESEADRIYPRAAYQSMKAEVMEDSAVPIEQGEIVVQHQVQLRYAIQE